MIYSLLWAESLALCVLAVLFIFTFWQRTRFRVLGTIALISTLLTVLLFTVAQLWASIFLFAVNVTSNFLFYSIAFVVSLFGLCGFALWRGFRMENDQRRIAAWPLAHLGIATLAAFALYLTTMMTIDTTMQMKLANVRLEAGALAMAEAPPRPTERENAAVIYARAFERMEVAKKTELYKHWSTTRNAQIGELLKDGQDPKVREYLARMKPVLDLVRRAAAMPNCAFDRPYATPSLDIQLPELTKLRECTRLLAADARCRVVDGDIKGALQDVRAIQGIAEHLSYEPLLISGLVSVACGNIGVDALEAILRSSEPTAADLEVLPNDDLFSYRRVYVRSLRGEHAFGLSGFAMLGENNGTTTFDILEAISLKRDSYQTFIARLVLPYWRIYMMPSDLSAYNKTMEIYKRSATGSFKEYQETTATIGRRDMPHDGILTSMITPALGSTFKTFLGAEARQRLATLARAVSLYRVKNKAFPKSLDALVPEYISEIPTDPFDEKPLRMKTHDAGVTLYSVGFDTIDQDGAPPTKQRQDENDIVLRLGKVEDPVVPVTTGKKSAPALPSPPNTGF